MIILLSVHGAQGALCPDRWEGGEEGEIWSHGCLGPQEVWAFYKALQKLGTGCQMLSAHCKGGNLTQIPLTYFH